MPMLPLILSATVVLLEAGQSSVQTSLWRSTPACVNVLQADPTGWTEQSFEELAFRLPPGVWQTTRDDVSNLGGQGWSDGPTTVTIGLGFFDVSGFRGRQQRRCRADTAAGPVLVVEESTAEGVSVLAWNPALRVNELDVYVAARGRADDLPKLRSIVLGARSGGQSSLSCIRFSVSRLQSGKPWRLTIQKGLEVRLHPVDGIWMIDIGPNGVTDDFSWPVSPPYRSRSHAQIGSGYNMSTLESVSTGRFLRFVLTHEAYSQAVGLTAEVDRPDWYRRIGALGRGRLVLRFTGHRIREATDEFEWISFEGSSCVPGG